MWALCLSWPHRRALHEDKHKAPTQPLHNPLSLQNRGPFPKTPALAKESGFPENALFQRISYDFRERKAKCEKKGI